MFLECTKQQSVCGSGRATVTAWEVSILGNSRPLAVEQQTKGIVVRFFFLSAILDCPKESRFCGSRLITESRNDDDARWLRFAGSSLPNGVGNLDDSLWVCNAKRNQGSRDPGLSIIKTRKV